MKLIVEGPDGRRFELLDVDGEKSLRELGDAIRKEYMGDPWGFELVAREGTRRLLPARTLNEERVQDGDTLRFFLERTAGSGKMSVLYHVSDFIDLVQTMIAGGVATYSIQAVKEWLKDRRSREIRIKHGDMEITIKGPFKEKRLREQIDAFRAARKELQAPDVKVELIERSHSPNDG